MVLKTQMAHICLMLYYFDFSVIDFIAVIKCFVLSKATKGFQRIIKSCEGKAFGYI